MVLATGFEPAGRQSHVTPPSLGSGTLDKAPLAAPNEQDQAGFATPEGVVDPTLESFAKVF